MAKSKIQYANSDVMVINTNGTNHVKDTFATVMKMVNEFGVCKPIWLFSHFLILIALIKILLAS